jgi:hypothetical protein
MTTVEDLPAVIRLIIFEYAALYDSVTVTPKKLPELLGRTEILFVSRLMLAFSSHEDIPLYLTALRNSVKNDRDVITVVVVDYDFANFIRFFSALQETDGKSNLARFFIGREQANSMRI